MDLSAREFEWRLEELRTQARASGDEDCVECRNCKSCVRSTFCRDCDRLVGCHYCTSCENCLDCSHCKGCSRLLGCHHCLESENSSGSSYLTLSSAMSNCAYCFGCIGLSHKEFHILNVPHSQQDYFRITARLARELNVL